MPYSRFKEVNEERKKLENRLEELEREQEERKRQELEEKEEFKKLYEETKEQLEQKEAEYTKTLKKTALQSAAAQANANDPADIAAFVDLQDVELTEDGSVKNAEELISSLAEKKPYLFGGTSKKNVGSGTSPSDDSSSSKVWAWSEVLEKRKDQSWYEEHEEELDKARKEGRIDYSK